MGRELRCAYDIESIDVLTGYTLTPNQQTGTINLGDATQLIFNKGLLVTS